MLTPHLRLRSSGILLHVTSLPGPHGCGDVGPSARRFVDFLAEAGQRWWQMLPVVPPGLGDSPYSALSAFAGNPLLISLDDLAADGLLGAADLDFHLPDERVDFEAATRAREPRLRKAFAAFHARGGERRERFTAFCDRASAWLEDYVLYATLKVAHDGAPWMEWPRDLARRDPVALEKARREHEAELAYHRFVQYEFDRQWRALREYCNERNVGLIGDAPIFVAHDSADVWQHRHLFYVDEAGRATRVAGVPPDYFSATGQRWGNPHYRWKRMAKDGYSWWIERFRTTLRRFDLVRLDHFIGFQRYWEIDGAAPTAVDGRWLRGPGIHFFRRVEAALRGLPFIAEDLGAITPAVKRLRDDLALPGTRILQFAFGTDPSAQDFLPHNYPRRSVVYTGTHDNDTTAGWFYDEGRSTSRDAAQCAAERDRVREYLGPTTDPIEWALIRAAFASVARLVIVPMQDLLGLGTESRMNLPGTGAGNWAYRMRGSDLTPALAARLETLTTTYHRDEADEK